MVLPDRQRWNRLRPELEAVLGLSPKAQRQRLAALWTSDPGLAFELEALLRAAVDAGTRKFLDGHADANVGSLQKFRGE